MKEVLRCPHCKLNQYVTASRMCRRCQKPVDPPPEPAESASEPEAEPEQPAEEPDEPGAVYAAVRKNLTTARHVRQWSQQKLANKMGIPRTFVSRLKNHNVGLSLTMVERFAQAFGIPTFGMFIPHPDFESMAKSLQERIDNLITEPLQ